jgi:hypothetical protein
VKHKYCKTQKCNLLVVLYGCETWFLTLREEWRITALQNGVLGNVLGSRGEEGTGDWRKLHSEELSDMYYSRNGIIIIKSSRLEMGRACGTNRKKAK